MLLLLAAARPELLVMREDPALRVRSFMAFCFYISWKAEVGIGMKCGIDDGGTNDVIYSVVKIE